MYLNQDFEKRDDDHIYNILTSVFHITVPMMLRTNLCPYLGAGEVGYIKENLMVKSLFLCKALRLKVFYRLLKIL